MPGAIPVSLEVGDIVEGRVSKVDDEFVYVSTGFKTEGRIPTEEFKTPGCEKPDLSLDQPIQVMVMKVTDEDIFLSYRKVAEQLRWAALEKAKADGEPITGVILKPVKGGYRVDVGVSKQGFLPASHLGFAPSMTPAEMTGKELVFRLIEMDRERGNIVVSHKEHLKVEADGREKDLIAGIQAGVIVDGKVTRIAGFGAFVDIGGIEGLVHVSQISWAHVKNPADVLTQGQDVKVKILEVDVSTKRISLSMKQAEPDPWDVLDPGLAPNTVLDGKVTKAMNFGVFVSILGKYEGLVHVSELGDKKPEAGNFPAGSDIKVKVLHVDQKNRKIALGTLRDNRVSTGMEKYLDTGKKLTPLSEIVGGGRKNGN